MRLNLDIKPKKFVIKKYACCITTRSAALDAITRIDRTVSWCMGASGNTFSYRGYVSRKLTGPGQDTIYVYNIHYYKRGRYKNSKYYEVYVYSFDLNFLRSLGWSVIQNKTNFNIYKLNKNGEKNYIH